MPQVAIVGIDSIRVGGVGETDCADHHRRRTIARKICTQSSGRVHTAMSGNVRLASAASCVYCMVTTEYRWVETKIPAPRLGTRGGGSQWCNRLPEVAVTLVADFAFWVESRIRRRNGTRGHTRDDRSVEAALVVRKAPSIRCGSNSGVGLGRKRRCTGGPRGRW